MQDVELCIPALRRLKLDRHLPRLILTFLGDWKIRVRFDLCISPTSEIAGVVGCVDNQSYPDEPLSWTPTDGTNAPSETQGRKKPPWIDREVVVRGYKAWFKMTGSASVLHINFWEERVAKMPRLPSGTEATLCSRGVCGSTFCSSVQLSLWAF